MYVDFLSIDEKFIYIKKTPNKQTTAYYFPSDIEYKLLNIALDFRGQT